MNGTIDAWCDLSAAFGRAPGESLREASRRVLEGSTRLGAKIERAAELVSKSPAGEAGAPALIEAAEIIRTPVIVPRKAVMA